MAGPFDPNRLVQAQNPVYRDVQREAEAHLARPVLGARLPLPSA
jgi:uncharacterized protein (DUF1810 family)